jgi:hypothetical protein
MATEFASTLSQNRVHVGVVAGRLEITFEGHESSWGERLAEDDTLDVLNLLMAELGTHYRWGLGAPDEREEGMETAPEEPRWAIVLIVAVLIIGAGAVFAGLLTRGFS